jgi:hypothetical protein
MPVESQQITIWYKVRFLHRIYIEPVKVSKESLAYVWIPWSSTDISKGYPGVRYRKSTEYTRYFKKFEDAQRFAFQVVDDRRASLNKKLEELLEQEKELVKFCEKRS